MGYHAVVMTRDKKCKTNMRRTVMRKVTLEQFSVCGPSVTTDNAAEMDPATGKIGGLWKTFFASYKEEDSIPQVAYGTYSEYESDWSGTYRVTAAVKETFPGMEGGEVVVPGGEYLRFEKKGPLPQAALELWQEVWGYFQHEDAPDRAYLVDFEEYSGVESVAIFIGLKEGE